MGKPEFQLAGFKFKTRNGNEYFYDDNTGMVFYCPEILWEILNLYKNNSKAKIFKTLSGKYLDKNLQNYYNFFNRWANKSNAFFFIEDKKKSISPSEKEIVQYLSSNGFRQLILNITDECNLRCKYCIYSGNYSYSRLHNKNKMSFDIAKMAIDYYFTMFKKVWKRNPYRKPSVCFYGGEPLLNFSLIKKIITYVKSKFPELKDILTFNISTNGTLLIEPIFDYLISNDVAIAVSLDGNKYEHDRLRVDKKGKGTFSKVMKNLQKLMNKYPNYKMLIILSCYDWKTDIFCVKNFFNENLLNVKEGASSYLLKTSEIASFFTGYYNQYDETDRKTFAEKMGMLEEEYFNRAIKSKKPTKDYLDYLIGLNCNMVLFQQKPFLGARLTSLPYTSTCVPGEKLFVRHDGTYHMCEKINHHFPIGNVEQGLNIESIINIIALYNQQISPNCASCPIKRYCPVCYANTATQEGFLKDPPNRCESNIEYCKNRLSYIFSILEENPAAFVAGMGDYYKNGWEVDT